MPKSQSTEILSVILLSSPARIVYFNFKQHHISPSAYLPDWLVPLFLDHLPFEACARIWDVVILEGDSFLYRAALGILAVLEPRLFFPDRKELLELLRFFFFTPQIPIIAHPLQRRKQSGYRCSHPRGPAPRWGQIRNLWR